MWCHKTPKGKSDSGNRVSDHDVGNETRSYLYSPVSTADLPMYPLNMEGQQASSSEGKLEHLQDVAGLKLMVMQLEKAREAKEKRPKFSWSHVLHEFSQNTSMHGIAKTTEHSPFILRRMIWILVVCGGISLFLYQMSVSIMYYMSHPVTVNVQIIYNKTMIFPVVTICNLNVFKNTKAAELGYYELIHDIYEPGGNHNISLDRIPRDMTLEKLYRDVVHDRKDMIQSCSWDSKDCSADDFVTTITDHGVCHSFNTGRDGIMRNVTQTGSKHGLHVRLNVEQYEYMRGPNKGAGIKVLAHFREDVPLVRDLGQAVPPGSHAFVSIQLKQMNNLKEPYGECVDDLKLHYYPTYTQSACTIDCMERYLDMKCRCRLLYMPKNPFQDYPDVCTMERFISCVPKAMDMFNKDRGTFCQCPLPCQNLMFSSSITYASTSTFDTDQVLQSSNTDDLQKKYTRAREVQHKVDKQIVSRDTSLVEKLVRTAIEVNISMTNINISLHEARQAVHDINEEMFNRAEFHKYVLQKKYSGYVYWFVQAWELSTKDVDDLILGHPGFMKTYNNTMSALTENKPVSFKEVLKWQISEAASERFHLVTIAKEKLDRVFTAYNNSAIITPYNIRFSKRYDKYLIPKDILKTRRSYGEQLRSFIMEQLDLIEGYYKVLLGFTEQINLQESYKFDMEMFGIISANLTADILSLSQGQKMMEREIINRPSIILGEKPEEFEDAMKNLGKESQDLETTLNKTSELINNVNKNWTVVNDFIRNSERYLKTKNLKDSSSIFRAIWIDKAALCREGHQIMNQVEALRSFFQDIRARARNLDHDWGKVFIMYNNAMLKIVNDEGTKELYDKMNEDMDYIAKKKDKATVFDWLPSINITQNDSQTYSDWLGNKIFKDINNYTVFLYRTYANLDTGSMSYDGMMNNLSARFYDIKNRTDIDVAVGDRDIDFFVAYEAWRNVLDAFNASTKVDSTFFRENFIDMDIYLAEMYYEAINQQQGYELTSLFSDIGGSMGLFIGASVITFIELIDVIFLTFMNTRWRNKKQTNR